MKVIIPIFFYLLTLSADPITLPHALEILKQQNLEIKIAEYNTKSAAESEDMATAQHYGQLNFIQNISRSDDAGNVFGFKLTSREASFNDFGFAEFGLIPMDQPIQGLNYPDTRNFFQSKLRYELPIYTGNKITAYQEMAKGMKQISSLDEKKQLQEKIYELRKSYYNMALLEKSLKNLHLILNNMKRLENTTQNMIDEGYAKKVDILEVKSKEANVKRIITELEANKELLYHYLSFLLNQEVSEITTPYTNLTTPNVSTEEILSQSLDIQKAQTALNIHKSKLMAEESRYLPTIGAMAEMQTADNTFLGDASDHKSYTIGVQLKWNIFGGGGDSAAIEQAQIDRLKGQTQVELAKRGIALRIKEIQTNIRLADSQIQNLKIELNLAQAIYKNYEGRYKEQLISMSDVIIKQSIWLENILQLLKANNDRNQEIFALEKLAQLGDTND